jgi:hypothetical protein
MLYPFTSKKPEVKKEQKKQTLYEENATVDSYFDL